MDEIPLSWEIGYSQQFNEIMPCIYGRFMDKEARQWRQIYKVFIFFPSSGIDLHSLVNRHYNYWNT